MKEFIYDLKKYFPYARFTAIAELKSQVADSYIGWVWWILDPVLYMIIYTFIVEIVFDAAIENFSVFVFIGLISWTFFSSTISSSVNVVRSYRSVFLKTSMPKYIMIIVQIIINLVKLLIGIAIAILSVIVFQINISFRILEFFPVLIIYIIFTFGVSLFFAHIGVYIKDLKNVTTVFLRLLFYMSGIFYTLERLPDTLKQIYFYICPTGLILQEFRAAILYGNPVNSTFLIYWLIIGLIFCVFGLKIMKKYDKEYIKAV